jgi:hypothetical protein
MPITIREILASDTISGAADKINFNFDQLLLNGGGPAGPVGPQGPIGPIGGRGIRGSVWYEGIVDPNQNPNVNPPTLTPEDEDNYLQSNGEVWSYSASAGQWFLASINLRGPIGPAGTSGKFSEYRVSPYDQAGDTTMYPNPMTFSQNGLNEGVRAVIIGGLPSGIVPGSGNGFISSTLAQSLVQPDVSLLVHQFASNQGGIKFHGGSAVDNFTDNISHLSSIRLSADDILVIDVPKPSGPVIADGLRVLTGQRSQLFQAGKEIKFQTGNTLASVSGSNSFIVEAQRAGGGDDPTIQLNVVGTSVPRASFRLGGTGITPPPAVQTGDARLDAGLIVLSAATTATMSGGQQSNIYAGTSSPIGSNGRVTIGGSGAILGQAPAITLNGTTSFSAFAGGATVPAVTGHAIIGASQQISLFTSNNSSGGGILVATGNNTPGSMLLSTGSGSSGGIIVNTSLGSGSITLLSGANTGISAVGDVVISAGDDVVISAGDDVAISAGDDVVISPGGDVVISAGDDVAIAAADTVTISTSPTTGGSIGLVTQNAASQITLLTLGTTSPINLNSLQSDINLNHGIGGRIAIKPLSGNSNALVDVRPTGTGTRSSINIFHAAAGGDTNLLLRSDATNGGEIGVSPGMRLGINGGITTPLLTTDTPAVSINALNHYDHATPITVIPNIAIVSSGERSYTLGTKNVTIYWQRVGNVINCSGSYTRGALIAGSNPSETLPVIGSGGTSIPHGTGTLLSGITPTYHAVQVVGGLTPNSFGFVSDQNLITVDVDIKFSFSYVIQ